MPLIRRIVCFDKPATFCRDRRWFSASILSLPDTKLQVSSAYLTLKAQGNLCSVCVFVSVLTHTAEFPSTSLAYSLFVNQRV